MTALVRIGDTVADPRDDVRGRQVKDCDGVSVGTVVDLLVDTREGKVRFLRVDHGRVAGFDTATSLLPVEAVSRVTPTEVHLDQTASRVAGAPRPADLPDRTAFYRSLYGYYDYPPFWSPGHIYPPFPHQR